MLSGLPARSAVPKTSSQVPRPGPLTLITAPGTPWASAARASLIVSPASLDRSRTADLLLRNGTEGQDNAGLLETTVIPRQTGPGNHARAGPFTWPVSDRVVQGLARNPSVLPAASV